MKSLATKKRLEGISPFCTENGNVNGLKTGLTSHTLAPRHKTNH